MTQNEKILNSIFDEYALEENCTHTIIRRIFRCEHITNEEKEEFIKDILEVAFEENPHEKQIGEFIKQSSFLLKNNGFTCVGKYKNWFWISSEDEGDIFYCGTTLQELAYSTNIELSEFRNLEELAESINDFTHSQQITTKIINNFLNLCKDNGVEFNFAEIKNVKVDKNEEHKFIEAVKAEFGFTPEPSYIESVG